jgi:HD-like signal output (HDOD) protein
MVETTRNEILRKIATDDCLPSARPVLMRLLELAATDNSSISDLALLIQQDPGLATHILKIVNSPFYTRGTNISSIRQAVLKIGFAKLRMIALGLSLRAAFPLIKIGAMDYEHFWKTSLYRAFTAQGVAQAAALRNGLDSSEVFTGGLILEIGLPVLYHVCPADLRDSFVSGDLPLSQIMLWQKRHLGITHREVGRVLLQRWKFPEQFIEAQRHFGRDALKEERSYFCRIIEFSRAAARISFGGREDFHYIQEVAPLLGLDAERVSEILCSTFMMVEEVAEQFQLSATADQDLLAVMEKANCALGRIEASLEAKFEETLPLVLNAESSSKSKEAPACPEKAKARDDDLLDAIAHEFRNPLMAIGGFAQRLYKNVEGKGSLEKYARIILDESSRMERLLNDIMSLNRPFELRIEAVEIVPLVEKAIDGFTTVLAQKGVRIVRSLSTASCVAPVDPEAITKAVLLLLETVAVSIRHDAEATVSVESICDAGEVVLSICAPLRSMSSDISRALPEGGFSTKTLGPGINVALSRKIIEAHSGRFDFSSDMENNCFTITLSAHSG